MDEETAARLVHALLIVLVDTELLPYLNAYFRTTGDGVDSVRVMEGFLSLVDAWLVTSDPQCDPCHHHRGAAVRGVAVAHRTRMMLGLEPQVALRWVFFEPLALELRGGYPVMSDFWGARWAGLRPRLEASYTGGPRAADAPAPVDVAGARRARAALDVAYRPCPEVDVRGMVSDARRAVAWVKSQAASYGVDPEKGNSWAGCRTRCPRCTTWLRPSTM